MKDLTEIENVIVDRLNHWSSIALGANHKVLGIECTSNIKNIIGEYGLELGYEVSASGNIKFDSEWLYDVIWSNSNEFGFSRLELILESELSRNLEQIKYDFDKLLVGNANHRIMICMTLGNGKGVKLILKQCSDSVSNYELLAKDSRFLVLIWDDYDSGKFLPHLIIK
tara:strand:- start:8220 stop:8726 length:507 start_codon:yes stop_codon:yes gene_type:complete